MTTALKNPPAPPDRSPKQVARVLRERIRAGFYAAGEWLPAERSLTEDLHVHRRVVREAIVQLTEEGLLARRPNCRPIVQAGIRKTEPADVPPNPQFPSSRLVALVMWHGGSLEQGATAQQRIFWGINQALGVAGYHAVFLDLGREVGSEQANAASEAAHLRYALDHGFGGVVFYPYAYHSNRELIQEVSRAIPLILLDRMVPGVEADFVGIENRQAMFEATSHLIGLGHRRIAYVTRNEEIKTVQDRLQGYLHALRRAFREDAHEIVLSTPSVDGGAWPVFDTVFRLPPSERPTAVLCVNDYEAVRVTERLDRIGLCVPQDVSVVGFDDIIHTLPNGVGLTTVAQPFEEIGRLAAQTLLRRLQTPALEPAHRELPSRLIVRDSSGPARTTETTTSGELEN